ncbi:MAG TPA: helix-turn-helix domain-containing protein [Cerasibacillus sp.]|uniref:AraC family transcriptional regulator n=1 Tax=Cerasibacillus sp. TaxID=2498711 RepID=UPI002F417210
MQSQGGIIVSQDWKLMNDLYDRYEANNYNFHLATLCLNDVSQLNSLDPNVKVIVVDLTCLTKEQQYFIEKRINFDKDRQYIILDQNLDMTKVRMYFRLGVKDVFCHPLQQSDIEELFQSMNLLLRHHANQKNKNKKVISYLKRSLAYDLLFGRVKSPKEIWDRSYTVGLTIVPNIAMVVHIDQFKKMIRHKNKKWAWSIRQEISDVIGEYIQNLTYDILVIPTDINKIAILLAAPLKNNPNEYVVYTKKLAEELKELVLSRTHFSVTIGIGNFYEDARNLESSYREAYQAQRNKFYIGDNTVTHIQDINQDSSNHKAIFYYDVSELSRHVLAGDFIRVNDILDSFRQILFEQKNVQPQMFYVQMMDILTTIARAAVKSGADPKNVHHVYRKAQYKFPLLENVFEVEHYFQRVTDELLSVVMHTHNEQSLRSVQKAMTYIEAHFNQHITLEEIAEHVNLSPNYFSNIFKKTTGKTFVEYLSQRRIEQSKELLLDLDYTVYQVAHAVGYNDARYFSRVFKSIVGKTPTKYRNSKLVRNMKRIQYTEHTVLSEA